MTHDEIAARLTCGDCNTATLTFEGMFGPRGGRFARYECPDCGTSWPEGSVHIKRQLAQLGCLSELVAR